MAAGRPPAAPGEDGLRYLEAVMAAYESAALGRTVPLPLERTDPLFLRGVIALREFEPPAWSPVRGSASSRWLARDDRSAGGPPLRLGGPVRRDWHLLDHDDRCD